MSANKLAEIPTVTYEQLTESFAKLLLDGPQSDCRLQTGVRSLAARGDMLLHSAQIHAIIGLPQD
jgi:hypothetical protein